MKERRKEDWASESGRAQLKDYKARRSSMIRAKIGVNNR